MRRILHNGLLCALTAMGAFTTVGAEPIAFPGALGFGATAVGGRYGTVYHVTNLNDDGEGSFRDAVSHSNRIVVFDVGGNIRLKTAVQVQGNITIAGQTAPGGIAIDGGKVSCGSKSNIIIRHIRVRPGSETASQKDDGINMYRSKNCIIDHCSVEFSPWNNIGGSGSNDNKSTDITFQYCLIADPIYQQFGAHIESVNSQWTWYGNCFANTHNRNPLDKVNDVFVNNILYNYQAGYTTHTSTKFSHDIVNNYFVAGPTSGSTDNTWFQVDKNQSIYYSGNMKDRNADGVLNGAETTPYWYQGTGTILSAPWCEMTKTLPIMSAATAYRAVSSLAGARPLDEMDNLIWRQVLSIGKEGAMYKSQTETGLSNSGYGTIKGGTKATDTDNDGMPDYWERTMGLDIDTDDAMTIRDDGYANIEGYINWLGGLHAVCDMDASVSVNLTEYTIGWTRINPSLSVGNAVNGTVKMSADGKTAVFTPNAGFYGLGSFSFTVKGNDGTAYNDMVNVLVVADENATPLPANLTKHGGGSSNQTIKLGESIVPFFYNWSRAKTVEIAWEPNTPKGIEVAINNADTTISFSGTPEESGLYTFTVSTVGNDEPATKSGSINILTEVRVKLMKSEQPLISRNPDGGIIKINAKGRLIIYSITGVVVLTKELNGNENIVDISMLHPGAYIVRVERKNDVCVERIVVEK